MRLNYLAGEFAAGLAAFERLERLLDAEFGTRPSAATNQLAQTLRAADRTALRLPMTRQGASVLPVTLKRPPRMVGRAEALEAARRASADGRVAWIEGEAGLGKSRLVGELIDALQSGPNEALVVHGRPGDAGVPYATLARMLAPRQAQPLQTLTPASQAALQQILVDGGEGVGRGSGALLRRGALQAAVVEWLAGHGIVLVVVDDVHHADEASLELLAVLAGADDRAVRWVFATRPAEAPTAARRLREVLTEWQRLQIVTLAPLGEAGVAELVDTLGVDGLHGAVLAAVLRRHTGGNPLFVLETLKQGLQDGSLARGELPRPAGVSALIDLRLARLTEPALMLARVAAIAGVDFCIELAEAATGARALHLATAWQELQDAQILRDEAFAHDLVADAVLRSVPQVVARRVHAQCAQWLGDHGGDPVRLARHWLAGGEPAKAGLAFVSGARRAESTGRLQEESELLAHAAEAYAEAGLHEERFTALGDRVRVLKQTQFGDVAQREARQLIELATTDAQRHRAQLELLGLLTERGDTDEAEALGRDLLKAAHRLGAHELALRTACHLSAVFNRTGRPGEALPMLLDLRAYVEAQPDPTLAMLWHGDWAATLGELGRLRECAASYEVARSFARRAGLADGEGQLLLNYAVALRRNGLFDRALEAARQGRALSSGDTADATHVAIARLVVARDECETGFYRSALAALEEILPQFEAAGTPFWAQAVRMVLALLWLHLGQPARSVPLLRDERQDVPPWLQADRELLRLELAQALAQRAPTGALRSALTVAQGDANRGAWLRVRALHHQGPREALAQAAALADELRGTERFGVITALQVQRARAALAAGKIVEAARAADDAVARLDEGYAPDGIYRGEAWWIVSRALQAAGRDAEARQAVDRGAQWVTQQALPQVPAPFIHSFLNRNAANRELLAAASR